MNDDATRGEDLIVHTQSVSTTMRDISQGELRFYADNPRVYSALHADGRTPTQEEIQRKLQDMEHVRELIGDIRLHGGLIEPLLVRDGSLEVLEGNSRLAAYRFLASQDPIKWGNIRCRVLPEDTSDDVIFGYLGQIHIKGKKDWSPFEQAGFLHRRHKLQKVDLDTLHQQMGLGKTRVRQFLDTYQLMEDHNVVTPDKWSYFFEFVRSNKIKKARENYPDLENHVVEMIKDQEIERAQDLRDFLPIICSVPKVLKKFAGGSVDFLDAYEDALEEGGGDKYLKKLKSFRQWLARDEVEKALCSATGKPLSEIRYEMNKLQQRVEALHKKIK